MRTTRLGHSDLIISALGLGCMGMSEFYGTSDDTVSRGVLDRAFELGINFYDTADMYGHGHNERLLAGFIADHRDQREKLVIATKFGIKREQPGSYAREIDNSTAYMRACCEASLSRLGIDVIDLYYVHRLASDRPIEDVTADLARLVEEGKIRYIGFSEITADQLRRAAKVHPVAAVQTEYSLVTRDVEHNGVLDACAEVGAAFVAYSPLGRGFLTASQTSPSDFEENDFRRMNPRFQADAMERNLRLLDVVKGMAAEKNVTPAQLTLSWVLNKNTNVVPIPGTRHVRYLESNVAASDIVLTAEDMERLETTFHYDAVVGQRYPEEGFKGLTRE
ncbi:aldo/keto reductase [Desulfovibrio inopinatus]|uniref:aldo/keto reductase n=1 Tax=Desulfovibrio inopinatus TaxID=102109 RepID=UPI0003FCC054|nr:aldo/keto reductase [Desulfovibrio inopinatus]